MKPYHKQNYPPRRPAQPPGGPDTVHRYSHPIRTGRPSQRPVQRPERPAAATVPAPPPPDPPAEDLHRYAHPIRTVRPAARQAMEEMMGEVLEALARQSEMLEEALRRLERYNSDT